MITEEDIKKIQSDLTEEQFNKLLYLLQKDRINELKDMARKKCKSRFVRVMRKYINKFLNKLEENNDIKRKETINLLNQTKNTLKNVYKLINNREVVDATSLLRSAFENLIMGMMINEKDYIYEEFIDLSIDDSTRKYTKPQKLRNDFRKVLRKLDGEFFADMNNRDLKNLLDKFYDEMCLFTHSTILVNAMVEIEKAKNLDIYVVALKQKAYFVEILLYLCLKMLCGYKKNPIDFVYILMGMYILINDIPKENLTYDEIEKLNRLLHADFNKEYFDKNKETANYLIEEAKKLQNDLEKNPNGFIEILEKLVK